MNDILAFIGLAAPDDNNHLIKRVIGLPGDHVTCCNALGQMTVNGVPLDEPYINSSGRRHEVRPVHVQRDGAQGRHLGHG